MSTAVTAVVPQQDNIPTILRLAWPIILSRSSQAVIGLSDAMLVAHLGESALAATSTGAFNTFALLIFPMGITFILGSFSSQLFGAGDLRAARKYGFYGLLIALFTQLFALATIPATGYLLSYMPYSEEVRTLMTSYIRWRLISAGAAIGIEALAAYYGGLGRTQLSMIVSVVAMGLNVVLNWVLINGYLGAPAMGVAGSALANSISTFIGFAIFLGIFIRDGQSNPGVARTLKVAEFLACFASVSPSGLNWFFEFFAFNFFINVVIAGLGTTALAAMMAVFNLNSVSFMPAFGLASAGAILVGQSLGAKEPDRVPGIVGRTFTVMAIWQVLVGALYLGLPSLVLSAFTDSKVDSTAFMEVGRRILMLSVAWQLFDALAAALSEALRAAGDTAFTLWARMAISWLLFVPGSYYTVRVLNWSDTGAVSWVVFYLAALALTLLIRFRGGRWRSIELIDHGPSVH